MRDVISGQRLRDSPRGRIKLSTPCETFAELSFYRRESI